MKGAEAETLVRGLGIIQEMLSGACQVWRWWSPAAHKWKWARVTSSLHPGRENMAPFWDEGSCGGAGWAEQGLP